MTNAEDKIVVIYPVDGHPNETSILDDLKALFKNPLTNQLVKTVKFNDALHIRKVGPEIIAMAAEVVAPGTDFMADWKLADVLKTDVDTLKRYADLNIGIITVSSCISSKALMALREALPETKIAVVCALTDIPTEEFIFRYKCTHLQKIIKDVSDLRTALIDYLQK